MALPSLKMMSHYWGILGEMLIIFVVGFSALILDSASLRFYSVRLLIFLV
jgi:hypothetical protein